MKPLLEYLNSLSTADQVVFATACGTTVGYLRKAVSAGQRISAETCINIERESRGAVICETLRPDVDWGVVRRGACASTVENRNRSSVGPARTATETVAVVV